MIVSWFVSLATRWGHIFWAVQGYDLSMMVCSFSSIAWFVQSVYNRLSVPHLPAAITVPVLRGSSLASAVSWHVVHTVQCQWTLIMSYTYPVPSFANGTCCWVEVLVPGSPAGSLVYVPGYWHLWWSCFYVLQHQLCCLLMAPYLEHCYPAPGIPLIKMNWLMDPSLMILLKYFHTITSHNFTKS